MLFKRGDGRGKCPFNKWKPCEEKCILYRRGVRYSEDGSKSDHFEECALNIMTENLEMMHQRIFMLQSEMGETKNATMFDILVRLGEVPPEELTRQVRKMVGKTCDDVKKLEDK